MTDFELKNHRRVNHWVKKKKAVKYEKINEEIHWENLIVFNRDNLF